jgi:hypothetical protein
LAREKETRENEWKRERERVGVMSDNEKEEEAGE